MDLKNYRLRNHIKLNVTMFKLVGLWNEIDKKRYMFRKLYWIHTFFTIFFLMGLFNLGQILSLLESLDLESFSKYAYIGLSCALAFWKSILFLYNRNLFKRLLSDLDLDQFKPKNSDQAKQISNAMWYYKVAYWVLVICSLIIYAGWVITPLLTTPRSLTFVSWYPYDWHKSALAYLFTYLHQSLSILVVVITNNNLDGLLAGFFCYIAAECEILSDTLRNLKDFTGKRLEKAGSNLKSADILAEMNKDLIECVKHYRKIVRFAKAVEEFYGGLVFAQFAVSTICICMTMLQLSKLTPKDVEFVTIICYQMGIAEQLFVYCWFGNFVRVASEGIFMALYESYWMDCPELFKKNLLFFMVRAKSPIQILALNFFFIDLNTYLWILKTAWSTFLVLRQANQN